MNFVNNKLITWLIKELEKRGWSQRELARRAKLSQTSISDVIAKKREPTWDFCAAIANALGESPEEVFRLAGLLPPLLASEDDPILGELLEVARRLGAEDREEVLAYAKFRWQGRRDDSSSLIRSPEEERELAELIELLTPMTPDERGEIINYLLDYVRRQGVDVGPLGAMLPGAGPGNQAASDPEAPAAASRSRLDSL